MQVGVIENDARILRAMTELWKSACEVRVLDARHPELEGLDALVVDPSVLSGSVREFCRRVKLDRPGLRLILTYLYNDVTQDLEEELSGIVDAFVTKPYDLDKLSHTLACLVSGSALRDDPSSF